MTDAFISRTADPLKYWQERRVVYPNLTVMAKKYLCMPATSVPCERIFSKAGEVYSKTRNRLNAKTAEQLLFLNKNVC